MEPLLLITNTDAGSAQDAALDQALTVLREGNQAADAEGGPAQPVALPNLPPPNAETEPTDFAALLKQAVELRMASQRVWTH